MSELDPLDPGPLLDRFFGDHDRVLVPWPRRSRRKDSRPSDPTFGVLDGVQRLQPVPPSALLATQRWVTRAGVRYYLTGTYERTGRTYADHADRANQFPLLIEGADGFVIVTGHHRSTAALLAGRAVWARLAPGRDDLTHRSVTAAIHVGVSAATSFATSVEDAAAQVMAGNAVTVADDHDARAVLERLDASQAEIATQLRFSHTGRLA